MTVKLFSAGNRRFISHELKYRRKPVNILIIICIVAQFIPYGVFPIIICQVILLVKLFRLRPLIIDHERQQKTCGEFKITYKNDDPANSYIIIDADKPRKIFLQSMILTTLRESENYYYEFASRSGHLLLLKKKNEVIFGVG